MSHCDTQSAIATITQGDGSLVLKMTRQNRPCVSDAS